MAFGLRWGGMGVFIATETRVQLHEWMAILTGTMVQGILIVFVAVLAPGLLPLALIGAMVYSVFLIGQRVLNEAAYIRIDHKLNELYHASPLSPEAYFLGMTVGIFVAYMPPVFLFVVLLEIVHPLTAFAWGILALCLLAVWIFSSTIGYIISTLFRDMKTIWPYSSLLTNLFGIVPPVFYPLAKVPAAFQGLALLAPTSAGSIVADFASDIHIAGIADVTVSQALTAGVALAVEAGLLFLVGIYWARRTAREA